MAEYIADNEDATLWEDHRHLGEIAQEDAGYCTGWMSVMTAAEALGVSERRMYIEILRAGLRSGWLSISDLRWLSGSGMVISRRTGRDAMARSLTEAEDAGMLDDSEWHWLRSIVREHHGLARIDARKIRTIKENAASADAWLRSNREVADV
jgi:hypothetical protein